MNDDSTREMREIMIGLARLEVAMEAGDRETRQMVKYVESAMTSLQAMNQELRDSVEVIKDFRIGFEGPHKREHAELLERVDLLTKQVEDNTEWRKKVTNRFIGAMVAGMGSAGGFGAWVSSVLNNGAGP